MNNVITACLLEENITPLINYPKVLMIPVEQEMVGWILNYYGSYARAPTLSRFMDEYDTFIPIDEKLPAMDVYNQEIKLRLRLTVRSTLLDAVAEIDETGIPPVDKIRDVQQVISLAAGVYRYSDFDRSLYVRKSTVDLPFRIIDLATGGMANGEVLLLAGRLGVGKSTLLRWITNHAFRAGKRVLFVSTEALAPEVFAAIDGMVHGVSMGRVTGEDGAVKVKSKVDTAGEIFIPRSRMTTPIELVALARSLVVDLVIIDGVYLLNPSGKTSSSRWERVAAVSNEIKQAALDLEIPMICSAQIKRGVSLSSDEWYSPEDIGLSDSLGQDADFILTIKRVGVVTNRLELQLIKNRYGYNTSTLVYIDHDNSRIIEESVEGAVELAKPSMRTISIEEWTTDVF